MLQSSSVDVEDGTLQSTEDGNRQMVVSPNQINKLFHGKKEQWMKQRSLLMGHIQKGADHQ
jgi:hypothetical protein